MHIAIRLGGLGLGLADGFWELLPLGGGVSANRSVAYLVLRRQAMAREALIAIGAALAAVGAYELHGFLGRILVGAPSIAVW